MQTGRVNGTVYKRSILRQLHIDQSNQQIQNLAVSSQTLAGMTESEILLAMASAANHLAARGATLNGSVLSFLFSESVEESEIKSYMQQVDQLSQVLALPILSVHSEITGAVNRSLLTVTAVGDRKNDSFEGIAGAKPNQDIVLSKWIGMGGTAVLATDYHKELEERFSPAFLLKARAFRDDMSIAIEAATAGKSGVSAMHDLSEGGIFGALWEMAEASGVGLCINLKAIPVKQETIEICNHFDISPYGLLGIGSLLMVVENGYHLVRELSEQGITSAVIGRTTEGNDRVVVNEEEKRFLDLPRMDELYRLTQNA